MWAALCCVGTVLRWAACLLVLGVAVALIREGLAASWRDRL